METLIIVAKEKEWMSAEELNTIAENTIFKNTMELMDNIMEIIIEAASEGKLDKMVPIGDSRPVATYIRAEEMLKKLGYTIVKYKARTDQKKVKENWDIFWRK